MCRLRGRCVGGGGRLAPPLPLAPGSHLPPGGGLSQAPWGLASELSLPALAALDEKGIV